jgi:hypothetical protein
MARKLWRAYIGSITLEIEKYEDAGGFHYCLKHDSNWGRRGGITPFLKYNKLMKELRHEVKVGFEKIGD